jgi:hypothetical protein
VLLDEQVEQRLDGRGTVAGGEEVPAPKREDLLDPIVEPMIT